MDKVRSLYLECLRISAAVYVFIYHVGSEEYNGELYFSTKSFSENLGLKTLSAHYFVVIFFVLSGYLITMSISKPGVTFKNYIIARLGRLYSVLIPALTFSYLVYFVLVYGNIIPADQLQNNSNLGARFVLNLLFLSQTWTLWSTPPLNRPFWSVDYESIYYFIIGTVFLIKDRRVMIASLVVILAVAWPKVLVLFPAWMSGSILYFITDKVKINKYIAIPLFLISLFYVIAVFVNPSLVPFSKDIDDHKLLGFNLLSSWNYQADFFFSVVVAANIYLLFAISKNILSITPVNLLSKLTASIKKIGNCSYTLYLFHMPLLFLFAYVLPYNKTSYVHQIGLIALVFISVYFIARYTEWKVTFWRLLVEKCINFISAGFGRNIKTSKI